MAKSGRKPKKRVWTTEEDEALKTSTLREMTERFGVKEYHTLRRRLELGIAPQKRGRKPKPKPKREKKEKADLTAKLAEQLIDAGGCPAKLARKLGVSEQAVGERTRAARKRTMAARGDGWNDLHRHKFGRLEAVIDSGRDEKGSALWVCKCKCGKGVLVPARSLESGGVDSCGCLVYTACQCGGRFEEDEDRLFCDECRKDAEERLKDWTGRKFDRLTVLRSGPNSAGQGRKWICACSCGKETGPIRQDYLKGYKTRSCGCLQKEVVAEIGRTRRKRRVTVER